MKPIAVIGNVNVDLILGPAAPWPQPGTEIIVDHDELRVGGCAGNSALALKALGVPFALAASIGSDRFGAWLASEFGEQSKRWRVHDENTTISVGITHPDGERTFFTTLGHLPHYGAADVLVALDGEVHRGGLALFAGPFLMPKLSQEYGQLTTGPMNSASVSPSTPAGRRPAGRPKSSRRPRVGLPALPSPSSTRWRPPRSPAGPTCATPLVPCST